MPYPDRRSLHPLSQFAGDVRPGVRIDPVIAELTNRTHSAVRNILERAGVHRRGSGAPVLREPEPPAT